MTRVSVPSKVLEFVGPREVLTSKLLLERLIARGYSRENARQIVSRLGRKGDLWRSERFRLPGGERLYARKGYWGTDDFCKDVARLVSESQRHGVGRCLAVLGRQDAVHSVHARKLLAAAVGPTKARYPDFSEEVEALRELGVTFVDEGTPLEHLTRSRLVGSETSSKAVSESVARLRVECLLARVLVSYFRKQNLMTWNRYELPSFEKGYTEFNGQVFTAFGYSYLDPCIRWTEDGQTKACPVLLDVHGGRSTQEDVESFLQRIGRATHRGKSKLPALGIVAAEGFTEEAWKHARTHRLMAINLRQMFGDEALEAMALVEDLLRRVASESSQSIGNDIASITALLSELRTNPVVVTIRSIAFEGFACSVIQSLGYQRVGLGKHVPFENTTGDVDVYGWSADTLKVVECKAVHSEQELTSGDVRKFFTETVPSYLKWLRQRDENPKRCEAEVWTTGKVGTEAEETFAKLKLDKIVIPKLCAGDVVKGILPTALRTRGEMLLNSIALYESPPEGEKGESV